MKSDHEILLPLENPDFHKGTHIQVSVNYDKGGECFATFKVKPRGYYLSVGSIGIRDNARCFGLFSHPTEMIEPAKRLSAKRLEELFHAAKLSIDENAGRAWEMVQDVLGKSGRKIACEVCVP